MDQVHSTTPKHEKGKQLTYDERMFIQIRIGDGWSAYRIAKELGCASNTVRNEIRRGTVSLYNGNVQRYKSEAGQKQYEQNRKNCGRHYSILEKTKFLKYVETHFKEDPAHLSA